MTFATPHSDKHIGSTLAASARQDCGVAFTLARGRQDAAVGTLHKLNGPIIVEHLNKGNLLRCHFCEGGGISRHSRLCSEVWPAGKRASVLPTEGATPSPRSIFAQEIIISDMRVASNVVERFSQPSCAFFRAHRPKVQGYLNSLRNNHN